MQEIKWIRAWFFTVSICLFCIAALNFIVDPGKIYLNKIIANDKARKYTQALINSKYGAIQSGWNARLVKTTIAKTTSADCYVLGSSHVMQISLIRKTANIQKRCSTLFNLGVSGAGIEDIAIMSYFLTDKLSKPKAVFIGIDPWDLKFNMDSRYGVNQDALDSMNKLLNVQGFDGKSYLLKYITNLLNLEYTVQSFELLKLKLLGSNIIEENDNPFDKKIQLVTTEFSFENGTIAPVTLQDGSHVYQQNWIVDQSKKTVVVGGGNYKIKEPVYENEAIDYLKRLILFLQNNEVEVHLLMTPYHPNVFKSGETVATNHMKVVEKIIHGIAQEYKIAIYGSYDPKNLDCESNEFFDFMHAKNSCLNKLDFSLQYY